MKQSFSKDIMRYLDLIHKFPPRFVFFLIENTISNKTKYSPENLIFPWKKLEKQSFQKCKVEFISLTFRRLWYKHVHLS